MSLELEDELGEGMIFRGPGEISHALENGHVSLHAKVNVATPGVDEEGNEDGDRGVHSWSYDLV